MNRIDRWTRSCLLEDVLGGFRRTFGKDYHGILNALGNLLNSR